MESKVFKTFEYFKYRLKMESTCNSLPIVGMQQGSWSLSQQQLDFFNKNGFLHIPDFFSPHEIDTCIGEIKSIEATLCRCDTRMINGIPIYWGRNQDGGQFVHRLPFLSTFSPYISSLINSERIKSLFKLLPGDARLGEFEKDGLVLNQYTYTKNSKFRGMGWHTDSVRDLFYFKKIYPMLNVGIHLTDSGKKVGSLRVLPGSHRQSLWSLLTKKLYYINNTDDDNEVAIISAKGDLTVHHGHIWHRVKPPEICDDNFFSRKVMYIPIICCPVQVKDERSKTPLYHKVIKFLEHEKKR